MLEYEKKIMLTKEEYTSIITLMRKYKPVVYHTNYYFDDDNFSMNKKRITCRIRAKDGKFKSTIKIHGMQNSDCNIEQDLFEKTEFDCTFFKALGLQLQGELTTERIIVYKDSCFEIVMDRNTYLGQLDYELEVEYRKESEDKIQSILKNIAEVLFSTGVLADVDEFLKRVDQSKSKSQRFFEKKVEMR